MRLLITGGAGFIGSALVRHCISHTEHEVFNIDKLTYAGCRENLTSVENSSRYHFFELDICDASAMERLMYDCKPDAVIHLAAESHVDRSIDGPATFIETNIVGTFALLQAARKYWRDLPTYAQNHFRFQHISTDEVFGSLGKEGYFTEATAYQPNSPYSSSKASSDHLVRAWHHTYGLPVLISNCSNNYGPYQFPEKLIPVVILAALEGRPIPVYGKGENIRDWLYVDDHVRALLTILEKGVPGETYNVGGHNEMRNIDLVKLLCEQMDRLAPRADGNPHADSIIFVADRPGHDQRYAIDSSKIEKTLGWSPTVDSREGFARTITWYLENRHWWEVLRQRAGKRLGLSTQSQASETT